MRDSQLDLVESDYARITGDPSYSSTYVYGNVLVEPDGAGNSQIAHYGGDGSGTYRGGTLYFFHNTVFSERPGNTTLVRLSTAGEHAELWNNVIDVAGNLAMVSEHGTLTVADSWLESGWTDSFDGSFDGTVTDAGTNTTGTVPDFVDPVGHDFTLQSGSPAVDAGTTTSLAPAHPVDLQYGVHQGIEVRPDDGLPDLGAFER